MSIINRYVVGCSFTSSFYLWHSENGILKRFYKLMASSLGIFFLLRVKVVEFVLLFDFMIYGHLQARCLIIVIIMYGSFFTPSDYIRPYILLWKSCINLEKRQPSTSPTGSSRKVQLGEVYNCS